MLRKHIPHDSRSFCAVTRERIYIPHDSESFAHLVVCAVIQERGVNTYHMTHELLRNYSRTWRLHIPHDSGSFAHLVGLRSYSRAWRKHVSCVLIFVVTQKGVINPTYFPRKWRKHIPCLQLNIVTKNNTCYVAVNR